MKTFNQLSDKKLWKLECNLQKKILTFEGKVGDMTTRRLKFVFRLMLIHQRFLIARDDFMAAMYVQRPIDTVERILIKRLERENDGKVVNINRYRK